MTRKKDTRGKLNSRTTPKKGAIANFQDEDGELRKAKWCSRHLRWESID